MGRVAPALMREAKSQAAQLTGLAIDPRGHNLLVGHNVEIDSSAVIGANVVIHDNVVIGPEVVIKHNAVIGQDPSLAVQSRAVPQTETKTTIGAGSTICNAAIVMRGAQLGENVIIGDQAYVREGARIGEDTVIGRACGVGTGAEVGRRVTVQSNSILLPGMLVEDDVFVGAYVCGATDNSIARVEAESNNRVILRRACRIGVAACLLPGVEIGEEAFVGAGAVVRESVEPRAKVAGVPARAIGQVAGHELLGN
jgi:acetyltransferase-like isoleucine patch superfamily enzyme